MHHTILLQVPSPEKSRLIYCINLRQIKRGRKVSSFKVKAQHNLLTTYLSSSEALRNSSTAQVFPTVVMATPSMLIKTVASFAKVIESSPRRAPKKSTNREMGLLSYWKPLPLEKTEQFSI